MTVFFHVLDQEVVFVEICFDSNLVVWKRVELKGRRHFAVVKTSQLNQLSGLLYTFLDDYQVSAKHLVDRAVQAI